VQVRACLAWSDVEARFHKEWCARFAPMGLSWEAVRPAFRFGWQHSQSPLFAEHSWDDVEGDLAQHWYMPLEAAEEMAWDNVLEAVREGWERARTGWRRTRSMQASTSPPSPIERAA
jgi:hypothetical protein